jgi:hypothetical protein
MVNQRGVAAAFGRTSRAMRHAGVRNSNRAIGLLHNLRTPGWGYPTLVRTGGRLTE